MVAKPYNAFTLADVEMTLLERPLFYIGDHYVTMLGLIAFAGFFAAGLLIARFLQSQIVRRFFQSFQNRHEFHRNRHSYLESGGDRLFHRYGGQCSGNSTGLERGSSCHQAEPGSDLSAGCACDRGVLDLIQDKAFSF